MPRLAAGQVASFLLWRGDRPTFLEAEDGEEGLNVVGTEKAIEWPLASRATGNVHGYIRLLADGGLDSE